ncbi:MAG: tetratricopeptide repeat protein [Chloroflexi bacterium]|nr:tetratricopeptide repeat protein [Chloroflexota bacterium]
MKRRLHITSEELGYLILILLALLGLGIELWFLLGPPGWPTTARVLIPPTSTPIPTPTAAPTPTPDPAPLLSQAESSRRNGDFDAAIKGFRVIIDGFPATSQALSARLGLGQTYLQAGKASLAVEELNRFLAASPDDPRVPEARFALGQSYAKLKEWEKAAANYQACRQARPEIAAYLSDLLGDVYSGMGQHRGAIEEYRKALEDAELPLAQEFRTREKLAASYQRVKEYALAVEQYDQILRKSRSNWYRAQVEHELGTTYRDWGKTAPALEHFKSSAAAYLGSPFARLSVLEAQKLAPGSIPPLQRAQVYYFNRDYDSARQVLRQAASVAGPESSYYLGLTEKRSGNYVQALREFDELIARFPGGSRFGDAWLERARTQEWSGDLAGAVATYHRFAQLHPSSPHAEVALWEAAELLEDQRRWGPALEDYRQITQLFPAGKYKEKGLFRRGLAYLRGRRPNYALASQAWQQLLEQYPRSELRSKALFWLGKALLLSGQPETAREKFALALEIPSKDYYTRRAQAFLKGQYDVSPKGPTVSPALAMDLPQEKEAFRLWLTTWHSDPAVNLDSNQGETWRGDLHFRRGEALATWGLTEEARDEFSMVTARYGGDPVALYQMARYFQEKGLYRLSQGCAEGIVKLAPDKDNDSAPRHLRKLIYPVYYRDLVVPEAARYNLDPLWFFALIWQESRFEPAAISMAQARGLTQVIPSTGQYIAEKLGKEDFVLEDLDRPYISIMFGTWYLGEQLRELDGNIYGALAAYNGGLGNVFKWANHQEIGDEDLFVEDIRFSETQLYVKVVYQVYLIYQELYGSD